jgi:hypothetical protein
MSDTLRGMFDPDASTVPGTVKEASRIMHTDVLAEDPSDAAG